MLPECRGLYTQRTVLISLVKPSLDDISSHRAIADRQVESVLEGKERLFDWDRSGLHK